jgi:hypothetical protein
LTRPLVITRDNRWFIFCFVLLFFFSINHGDSLDLYTESLNSLASRFSLHNLN